MEEYTNREISIKLEEINQGILGVHKRQDTTNGNIKDNRCRIQKLENWRWFIAGGLGIIMTCILPVLYLLISHTLK